MAKMSQNAVLVAEINALRAELELIKSGRVITPKADKKQVVVNRIAQAQEVYAKVVELALSDVKDPTTGYYKSFTGGVIIKKAIQKYGSYKSATEEQTANTILKAAKEYAII